MICITHGFLYKRVMSRLFPDVFYIVEYGIKVYISIKTSAKYDDLVGEIDLLFVCELMVEITFHIGTDDVQEFIEIGHGIGKLLAVSVKDGDGDYQY
mgnify:CR=1 FL=1